MTRMPPSPVRDILESAWSTLRALLFCLPVLLALPGCFAVTVPEPQFSSELISSPKVSWAQMSSIVALDQSRASASWSSTRSPLERLSGKDSLGHQYLFPFLPVTRLYFSRSIDDTLGELVLSHPKFGRSQRAITNISPHDLHNLFGEQAHHLTVDLTKVSASVRDFLLIRNASVGGEIKLQLDSKELADGTFSASRYVQNAPGEVLAELFEQGIFEFVDSLPLFLPSRQNASTAPPANSVGRKHVTIVCLSPPHLQLPCKSAREISRGFEQYLRKHEILFVSFRDGCPKTMPNSGYLIEGRGIEIREQGEQLELALNISLLDLSQEAITPLRLLPLSRSMSLISSSADPVCETISKLSEQLAEEFLGQ